MKTNFIIVAIIIVAISFGGCTKKENFDFRVTIVPESKNSVITQNGMNAAAEIISKRLNNSFGISQENMKLDVTEDQISLTISKADTSKIALIKKISIGYARLEFWETYENREIIGFLLKVNSILKNVLNTAEATNHEEIKNQDPFFGMLRPMIKAGGEPLPSCMIGLVSGKDTSEINKYLKLDQIKMLFPGDIKFFWSAKPYKYDPSKSSFGLHAIKVTTGNKQAPLDGSVIISAKAITGPSKSSVKIDLTMNTEGASTWANITRRNINRCIAVVLNGYVRSYPRVQTEISGGNSEISGDFTLEEANDFVNILKSGQLPFELKILSEQIIKK